MHETLRETGGGNGSTDVLFINHPNIPPTAKTLLTEPIDILTTASYIERNGHTAKILDMDAKRLNVKAARSAIEQYSPRVVVMVHDHHLPLHTSDALGSVDQVSKLAKEMGVKVVIGGKRATFNAGSILTPDSPIDVAISHDIEKPLLDLLDLGEWNDESLRNIKSITFRSGQEIVKTGPSEKVNLDECQVLDRSLVDLSDYGEVRTILSSRGCSNGCTFCPVTGYWGRWRGRSPENVADEIQYLAENYQTQKIMFIDDNATVDQERMRSISGIVMERGLKVKMGCLGTISSFDRETMQTMYKAGFRWIHYGVESGNEEVLQKIRKNLTRSQIESVINQTREIGFRIRTSWILDLPDTTETDLDETIDLIKRVQSDEIRLHFFAPRIGSTEFARNEARYKNYSEYIHNGSQVANFSHIPSEVLTIKLQGLLKDLANNGYQVVTESSQLKYNPNIPFDEGARKVVALCALRYGINW